jgi:hypothetical protein
MITELIQVLRQQLQIDEERIRMIEELKVGPGESLAAKITTEGIVGEDILLQAFSGILGLEVMDKIPASIVNPDLTSSFTISYLKQRKAVPLQNGDEGPFIAVNDPFDYETIDQITQTLKMGFVETVLAPEKEIIKAINTAFEEGPHTAEQVLKDIDEDDSDRIFAEIE